MRFSSLAVLALASLATAADLSTWNDVVGDVPQCIKTCFNDFYDNSGFKDKCGSADSAKVSCLCGAGESVSDIKSSASSLSSCISNGCSTDDLANASSSLQDFQTRFQNLSDQCSRKGKFLSRFSFLSIQALIMVVC